MDLSRSRGTVGESLERARARYGRLSPAQAHSAQQEGAIVIDTRCADALRDEGSIPGALHIPLSVLPWRCDPSSATRDERVADPGLRLILVCAHGFSSSLAVASLLDLGLEHATDVVGGFSAWREDGLPVVPPAD